MYATFTVGSFNIILQGLNHNAIYDDFMSLRTLHISVNLFLGLLILNVKIYWHHNTL